ncbi:MAG: ATP-dependent helicase [Deltaproteobacteria bacterium]|nr:ATP-dependent helicase [Deltaproteobacteria bacterium]
MTTALPLDSNDVLPDIEHHFRVTAGPGAGKTHWLAKHIRHVARTSDRMTPCSRIGAISYTNVAVRELLRRLGPTANVVDSSTIHSFLFRNLVRPHLHLLKTADGSDLVAHNLVETHGEHFPSHGHLEAWLRTRGKGQMLIAARKQQLESLMGRLRALTIRVDPAGQPFFVPCKIEPRDKPFQDLLRPESLLDYKQRYWATGTIDHEDVLYFAHRLMGEHSALRRFMSARFPYLFMDEFQDTLPVQAAIVRWLAEAGTVVGVIGDPEQAIFGFIDASPLHFQSFALGGHRTYAIRGNRRSTASIVNFLNRVRTDGLKQHAARSDGGPNPVVYAGSLTDALAHARATTSSPSGMLVLARKHDGVVRARQAGVGASSDPWPSIEHADGSRCRFLNCVAAASDLAQRGLFDLSIQRLVQGLSSRRGFRDPLIYAGTVDMVARRSVSLSILELLVGRRDDMLPLSVLDVYGLLQARVPTSLYGLRLKAAKAGGSFHTLASRCRYGDLILSLRATADEAGMIRTIHQAKGAEAPAVFLALDEKAIDHIVAPTGGDEEQRITYVALSRARDELYIHCPDSRRLPEFASLGLTTVQLAEAAAVAGPAKPRRKAKVPVGSPC